MLHAEYLTQDHIDLVGRIAWLHSISIQCNEQRVKMSIYFLRAMRENCVHCIAKYFILDYLGTPSAREKWQQSALSRLSRVEAFFKPLGSNLSARMIST